MKVSHSHSYPIDIIVPLVTPPNIEDFFRLIDHVLAGGIKNLVLFGGVGEGYKIAPVAKSALLKELVPFINGRANLFTVLFGPSLNHLIAQAQECEQFGFAGALVPLAFANDEHMFAELLKQTTLNYYLYRQPTGRTTVIREELFNMDRVVGIKDSGGDFDALQQIIKKHKRDDFKIYYGRESNIEKALTLDIDGWVPSTANLAPELVRAVWEKRDAATLAAFHDLKQEINAAQKSNDAGLADYMYGLKMLLVQRGIVQSF